MSEPRAPYQVNTEIPEAVAEAIRQVIALGYGIVTVKISNGKVQIIEIAYTVKVECPKE